MVENAVKNNNDPSVDHHRKQTNVPPFPFNFVSIMLKAKTSVESERFGELPKPFLVRLRGLVRFEHPL